MEGGGGGGLPRSNTVTTPGRTQTGKIKDINLKYKFVILGEFLVESYRCIFSLH